MDMQSSAPTTSSTNSTKRFQVRGSSCDLSDGDIPFQLGALQAFLVTRYPEAFRGYQTERLHSCGLAGCSRTGRRISPIRDTEAPFQPKLLALPDAVAPKPAQKAVHGLPSTRSMRPLRFLARLSPEVNVRHRVPSLALLLAALVSASPAQDATPVFRSSVSLIRIDAQVTDASGNTPEDLTPTDFTVLDNGAPQALQNFSFDREPLDLMLLFDLSGGMKGKLLQLVRAIELGFHELKSEDRVALMAFDRTAREVMPFSANLDAVNNAIAVQVLALHFGGNSDAATALRSAAERFRKEPASGRRRAILLISDRPSNGSAAITDLWKADVVLSELVLTGSDTAPMGRRESATAGQSGGATIEAGPPGPSFQRAVRLLRRRYTFYYPTPASNSGSQRSVLVRLSDSASKKYPGLSAKCRTGYLVP
jgi:hypothetical protein